MKLSELLRAIASTTHTVEMIQPLREMAAKAEELERATPEPWVPAKGDMVRANDKFLSLQSVGHDAFPNPMRVDLVNDDFVYVEGDPGPWNVKNLRPATEAEITRYEQEQVTELQEGDACEVTLGEKIEIADLFKPFGLDFDKRRCVLMWFEGRMQWEASTEGDGALPFDLFLKRARGTAARLKREAEEAEAKKPIAFGTRVKHIREDREYKIACDMPDKMGSYYLVRPGDALQLCTYAKRHEFTILP